MQRTLPKVWFNPQLHGPVGNLMYALVDIGHPAVIDLLIQSLHSSLPTSIKVTALIELGKHRDDPRVRQTLESVGVSHANAELRTEAERILAVTPST